MSCARCLPKAQWAEPKEGERKRCHCTGAIWIALRLPRRRLCRCRSLQAEGLQPAGSRGFAEDGSVHTGSKLARMRRDGPWSRRASGWRHGRTASVSQSCARDFAVLRKGTTTVCNAARRQCVRVGIVAPAGTLLHNASAHKPDPFHTLHQRHRAATAQPRPHTLAGPQQCRLMPSRFRGAAKAGSQQGLSMLHSLPGRQRYASIADTVPHPRAAR